MKSKLFFIMIFCVMVLPFSYGDILAEHTSANYDCGVTGTSYFAFKFDADSTIDTISFYGYNTLGSNTTIQYSIYSNNPLTNFSTGTTLQTTLANVTNTTGEIVIDFTDSDFVYNADTYYWIRLGGDSDLCYQTFYDGSTDVYENGGLNGINSIHDPRFEISGRIYQPEQKDYNYADTNSTSTTSFNGVYSLVWVLEHGSDFNITNITYSLDQTNGDSRKFIYGYYETLNYTACSDFDIDVAIINSSCWVDSVQVYNSGFISGSYRTTATFTPTTTQMDGTDIYRLRMSLSSYYGGQQNANILLSNYTTDDTPAMLSTGIITNSPISYTPQVPYIRIQGETLDTCSGTFCSGTNETIIPQPINDTGYVTSEERDDAIGLLFDTQDEDNPNKITAKGLLVAGLIIIAVMVSFASVTMSPLLLMSVFIKLVVLQVIMKTLPFYIVMLIIIGVLGFSLFRIFVTGKENGG